MTYDLTVDYWTMRAQAWREHVVPRLPRPFHWLEIGSLEGRSACWMLDEVMQTGDTITCVDVFAGEYEQRFDRNLAGRAEKHKCRSHKFLTRALATYRRFDGVYIDGDHEARAVLEDSVLAWRLLPVGGVIVWDDYLWQMPEGKRHLMPPKPAIDAFLAMYPVEVVHHDWQVIAQKVAE